MDTHAAWLAARDAVFMKACELAGLEPTRRQASKWRRRKGRAWTFQRQALAETKATDRAA